MLPYNYRSGCDFDFPKGNVQNNHPMIQEIRNSKHFISSQCVKIALFSSMFSADRQNWKEIMKKNDIVVNPQLKMADGSIESHLDLASTEI